MTAWTAALDRYEAALSHHEALLTTGEPAGGRVPWPPPDLPAGDLPPALRDRALDLLARTGELTRRLAAARDSLPPLPAGHRAPRGAVTGSAIPGRFDRAL